MTAVGGVPKCPHCGIGLINVAFAHTSVRPPALCPVCQGRGTVPPDFYEAMGVATSTARTQCRSCGGRGVL